MQSYHVSLNFRIAFAKCDSTPGQTPPGTPEEIADLNPDLLLVCDHEEPTDLKTRIYRSEMRIDAENDGAASHTLIDMFKHLPGFKFGAVTAGPVKHPPATAATNEYALVCRFRSTEAFFRLSHAFDHHVSEGVLFPAPKKPGQYVAYVVWHSPSSDDLEETVDALLREAFGSNSEETFTRFTEVTIDLL